MSPEEECGGALWGRLVTQTGVAAPGTPLDQERPQLTLSLLLDVALHGLPVARARGRRPWITPEAQALVVVILATLLGWDKPPRWWTPQEFIERALGWVPLTDGGGASEWPAAVCPSPPHG